MLFVSQFFCAVGFAAPQVTSVRVGIHETKTRVVVEVGSMVRFETFTLPNPYRVVVDMSEVTWAPELRSPPSGGVVSGMRFGLFKPGTSRIVLDTSGPVQVAKSFILPPAESGHPFRLVFDLISTTERSFMSAYNAPRAATPEVSAPQIPEAKAARKSEKRLVVIDPGHGGVDPGAMSRSGVWEKNIVLDFSRELRRQLLGTGRFDVQLTRDNDVFIRLRDRIAIARRAGADLFISVHADSIGNPSVRGTSVYTLSETGSDKEAEMLASKENRADLIAGVDLNARSDEVVNILIDLAQRETMNESAVFAKILVDEIGKRREMLRNTHRFAGFAVLKAPDVPSVLMELGYLSNSQDEKMLRSPAERRRMATSIVDAVDAYFERQQAFNRP
ncbi:MAG: N-acetylmuramoyl-L-alanine amidase [Rhodospirillaceae bacterium]